MCDTEQFPVKETKIWCSVRIFSSAGHNMEHFRAEDPPWVEVLFKDTDTNSIYCLNTENTASKKKV